MNENATTMSDGRTKVIAKKLGQLSAKSAEKVAQILMKGGPLT